MFTLTLDEYVDSYYELYFKPRMSKLKKGTIAYDLYCNGQYDDEPFVVWQHMFGQGVKEVTYNVIGEMG